MLGTVDYCLSHLLLTSSSSAKYTETLKNLSLQYKEIFSVLVTAEEKLTRNKEEQGRESK